MPGSLGHREPRRQRVRKQEGGGAHVGTSHHCGFCGDAWGR